MQRYVVKWSGSLSQLARKRMKGGCTWGDKRGDSKIGKAECHLRLPGVSIVTQTKMKMSDEFREMAAKAKADSLKKDSERRRSESEVEAARSTYVVAAQSVLDAHVMPVLEQAKTGLQAESIELRTEKVDARGYVGNNPSVPGSNPSVRVSCPRPILSSRSNRKPGACIFSSDGKVIFVEMEGDSRDHTLKIPHLPIKPTLL